jgi:predicted regulator of Ras-like GTPase activity (Roadblock/LC7/MglB family)
LAGNIFANALYRFWGQEDNYRSVGDCMSFEVILKNLVDQVPNSIGAILVDWEGEAVMEHCHCDPYDMRFIAAHYGIILGRLKEMKSRFQIGVVEDMAITASEMHLIIGCINQEYSLVMNVKRICPVDLALYHFRQAIAELKKEF